MRTLKNTKKKEPEMSPKEVELKKGEIYLPRLSGGELYKIERLRKDGIRDLLESFAKMRQDETVTLSPYSPASMVKIWTTMRNGSGFNQLLQSELADLYNSFASYLPNIKSIAEVDASYNEAWKLILNNLEVSTEDLQEIIHRDIKSEFYYGWGRNYFTELLFFPLEVSAFYSDYDYRTGKRTYRADFTLSPSMRTKLISMLYGPELIAPKLTEQLPENENLVVENFEPGLAGELMTLSGMSLNGSLLSSNGSMTAATVNKINKHGSIRGYRGSLEAFPLDRSELLALTYFIRFEDTKSKSDDVGALAKFAIEDMPKKIQGTRFNSFLPKYQGFTKSWTEDNYAAIVCRRVNKLLPARDWMSMDNFKLRLLCTSDYVDFRGSDYSVGYDDSSYPLKLFTAKSREKAALRRREFKNTAKDKPINGNVVDWFEEFGLTFAVNWIKYLCALGIVELAIDGNLEYPNEDKYAGIKYVRLTALGRYAMGMEAVYTPVLDSESTDGREFDGSNGIITLESSKSPYMMFLSNIAKQIGPTRFKISWETLIKGCRSKKDLEGRIQNLKTIFDVKKDPVLESIIKEALAHTDCVSGQGGYTMLKIKSTLPELYELVTTDEEFRKIAIPLGRMTVLIKTSQKEKFQNLCATRGFLMN